MRMGLIVLVTPFVLVLILVLRLSLSLAFALVSCARVEILENVKIRVRVTIVFHTSWRHVVLCFRWEEQCRGCVARLGNAALA